MKGIEGKRQGLGLRVAIIASRFNEEITDRLLESTSAELEQMGVSSTDILVLRVPGAYEIPVTVSRLVKLRKWDAVVCLGAVIKGETAHFEFICSSVLPLLNQIAHESGVPIANGIITAYTEEQAFVRSGAREQNIGVHAAHTAVEMANLFKELNR